MELLIAIISSSAIASIVQYLLRLLDKKQDDRKAEKDALMSILLDRIQYLCKTYIHDGEIDTDDLRRLHIMHKNYHNLGGNGDLDKLMSRVDNLPLKNM